MDFLLSPQTFLDICSRPDDIICIPDEYRSTIESTDDHLAVLSLSPYPWIADIGMNREGYEEGCELKHDKKRQWVVSVSVVGSVKPRG